MYEAPARERNESDRAWSMYLAMHQIAAIEATKHVKVDEQGLVQLVDEWTSGAVLVEPMTARLVIRYADQMHDRSREQFLRLGPLVLSETTYQLAEKKGEPVTRPISSVERLSRGSSALEIVDRDRDRKL